MGQSTPPCGCHGDGGQGSLQAEPGWWEALWGLGHRAGPGCPVPALGTGVRTVWRRWGVKDALASKVFPISRN